jgi:hypothetical protein
LWVLIQTPADRGIGSSGGIETRSKDGFDGRDVARMRLSPLTPE